jgi:carboxymethylenebutenolidase
VYPRRVMSERTSFSARNGKNADGTLRQPAGTGKAPAIVLIQEYWGINAHVVSLADRLAAEGFLVLAPDLYHGKIAKTAEEAGQMMGALDREQAVEEIGGAIAYLGAHARSSGKVGIIGFCLGGAFAFTAAALLPGLSAAVPFYGIPDPSKVDLSKIAIPVQAHFSKTDQWAKPELAEAVKKQLDAKHVPMELQVYDAAHAFMNDTRPEVYDAAAAKVAWGRAVAFLKKNLGAA